MCILSLYHSAGFFISFHPTKAQLLHPQHTYLFFYSYLPLLDINVLGVGPGTCHVLELCREYKVSDMLKAIVVSFGWLLKSKIAESGLGWVNQAVIVCFSLRWRFTSSLLLKFHEFPRQRRPYSYASACKLVSRPRPKI